MTEVKLTEVIRCSCEAPDFPASSLLQGANNARSWLSSPSSTDTTIEVELQFQKEVVISFLDIGNHGSQSVDILVSHTSREKDKFECLIPTSNFMTVAQSKQGLNTRQVQCFTSGDMLESSKHKTWDRLKLVCRQPYALTSSKMRQFGLAFVGVMTSQCNTPAVSCTPKQSNQNKLKEFFSSLGTPKLSSPTSSLVVGGKDVVTPKSNRLLVPPSHMNRSEDAVNPKQMSDKQTVQEGGGASPAARVPLTPFAIKLFKEEVNCFFQDINIEELLTRNCIRVSDLRQQMEQQRAKPLTVELKKLFMELVSDKFAEVKKKLVAKGKENKPNTASSPVVERRTLEGSGVKPADRTLKPGVVNRMNASAKHSDDADEVRCPNCGSMLPRTLITIHRGICKNVQKPKKPYPTPSKTPITSSTTSMKDQDTTAKTSEAVETTSTNSGRWLKAGDTPSASKTPGTVATTSQTPNRSDVKRSSNNRNRLCFDLGDSDDEGDSRANKRLKTEEQQQQSQQNSGKIRKVKSHFNSDSVKKLKLDDVSSSPRAEVKDFKQVNANSPPEAEVSELRTGTSSTTNVDIAAEGNFGAELSECPICFLKFPLKRIMVHASLCNGNSGSFSLGTNGDNSDSSDDDLPDVLIGSVQEGNKVNRTSDSGAGIGNGFLGAGGAGGSGSTGGSIVEEDSFGKVPCPICGTSVPQSIIEIHVNACLDGG